MHMRELQLQRLAHERLLAGELPPHSRSRLVACEGSGRQCALCGTPILFNEIQCTTGDEATPRALALHVICQRVWAAECSQTSC